MTLQLPLAVFSFSEASKVIIISHYFCLCTHFCKKKKQNRESHVCSLITASEHVAVKYGMNRTLLLVLVN